MTEVSLTDSEDEDTDDPLREPHDTIGKATICKYYSHFKKAIGNILVNIWVWSVFDCISVDYMEKESRQIGGESCVIEIGRDIILKQ